MTVFEALAVAPAVNRKAFEVYAALPYLEGKEGQQIEEIRNMLRTKRGVEIGLWQKIVGIYTPSE